MLGRVVLAPLHAGPDGGRRGVEDRHAVPLDDLPPDVLVRVVRGALEHHRGGAVGQRAVDDVGVPGDPADVGRAPEHVVLRVQVEDHRGGGGDRGQVAAGGVQDSLGLGGGAGGVEQEQRVLGLHRLGRADRVGAGDQVVEPHVASGPHHAVGAGGPDHHDRLQVGQVRDHVVHLLLDQDGLALAAGPVRDDQRLGAGDLQPLAHRGRGEAAEDDGVRRADPGAGQHGHHDLGDHREVDPDHVALAHALRLERVGEPLHVGQEFGVGQVAFLTLLAPPVERDPVAPAGQHVPVQAVVGHVDGPVGEPGIKRRVAFVEHRGEWRLPVQPLARLLGPPGGGVGRRLFVYRRVCDLSAGGELGRRRELLDLQQFLQAVTDRRRGTGHVRSFRGSGFQPPRASPLAALSAGREPR